jgi:hypothetical protein
MQETKQKVFNLPASCDKVIGIKGHSIKITVPCQIFAKRGQNDGKQDRV